MVVPPPPPLGEGQATNSVAMVRNGSIFSDNRNLYANFVCWGGGGTFTVDSDGHYYPPLRIDFDFQYSAVKAVDQATVLDDIEAEQV